MASPLQARGLRVLLGQAVRGARCEQRAIRAQLAPEVPLALLLRNHVLHPAPDLPWMTKQMLAASERVYAGRVVEPFAALPPVGVVVDSGKRMDTARLVGISPLRSSFLQTLRKPERQGWALTIRKMMFLRDSVPFWLRVPECGMW